MVSPKTLAKKQERARLAGKPYVKAAPLPEHVEKRAREVTAALAKRLGSPSRVRAPELRPDGYIAIVRIVLRGASPVGAFKLDVDIEHMLATPVEAVAERVHDLTDQQMRQYLEKPLANSRMKVAIEDEFAYREQN
jgi:hypothetical protein